MKPKNLFDLESAIDQWRQQMLTAGIKTPVPLEELESHLREEIEQATGAGRSEAEAFATAVLAIGQAPAVQGEFRKIAGPKDALRWKFMELAFGIFATVMPLCLCVRLLHSGAGTLPDLTAGQQTSGVMALVTFAALAWGGRLSYKMFPAAGATRTKNILTILVAVPVVVWWFIFMNLIVPRHDFTMGQFTAAFLWAFIVPGGAVIGLAWGLEAAAQKNVAPSVS
ncbi:MAG: hypothetical protein ABSH48_00370 [Verrucomicrobiota bacterium]|jgi:hypothetical protein